MLFRYVQTSSESVRMLLIVSLPTPCLLPVDLAVQKQDAFEVRTNVQRESNTAGNPCQSQWPGHPLDRTSKGKMLFGSVRMSKESN